MAYPRTGAKMVKTIWIGDVQSGMYDDQVVELKGWVKRTRGSNKIRFVVLRDSTGTIQCVAKRDVLGDEAFESVKGALIESSIIITGTVNVDERSEGGHELVVSSVEIVGSVNPERPFPITESAMAAADGGETEFLLDNRHLYLRTSRMTTMLKLRSSVFGAIHGYFRNLDFIEYQAPNFVAGAVKVAQPCSKFHTLDAQPTSLNLGNSMQKQPCRHLSGCTPLPLPSGLRNHALADT